MLTRSNIMIDLPPLAEDSHERGTFFPWRVSLGGLAGARAIAKFGYGNDTGTCMPRNEACFAYQSTLNEAMPYKWNSELTASDGVDCSSACTIIIPGISGRILRYVVEYRNSSGTILAVMPEQQVAIP
jgi:hypothetical protein